VPARKESRAAAKKANADQFVVVAQEWFENYQLQYSRRLRPLSPATIKKTQWLLCLPGYTSERGGVGAHPLKRLLNRPIQSVLSVKRCL